MLYAAAALGAAYTAFLLPRPVVSAGRRMWAEGKFLRRRSIALCRCLNCVVSGLQRCVLGWYSAMHSAAVHLTLYSLSVYLRNAGRRRCGRVSCRIVRHRSWHSSCCALNGSSCPSGRICGTRPSHSRRLGISCGIARGNAARRRAADCRHIIRCRREPCGTELLRASAILNEVWRIAEPLCDTALAVRSCADACAAPC